MANEIYNSSDWGNGVCDNAIDWGVVYKDFAGCTPSFSNTFSLAFDGVDDFVNAGSSIPNLETGDISFSVWAYPTSFSSYNYFLDSGAITTKKGIFAGLQITTGFVALLRKTGVTNTRCSTGWIDCGLTINNWYNIVGVFDEDGGTAGVGQLKLYVNGVLKATVDGSGQDTGTGYDLHIGKDEGGFSHFVGKIDEVSLYNYPLTSGNITTIYNSGVPNNLDDLTTPPTAWYRNGDNGSYKSPQWLIPNNSNKDKVSNFSFAFDGVDDYVDAGNDSSLRPTSAFAISFWMNGVGSGSDFAFRNGAPADLSNNSGFGFRVLSGANDYRFVLGSGSSNTSLNVSGVLSGWNHFLLNWNGSTMEMFINGVSEGSTSFSGPISYSTGNFLIGDRNTSGSKPYVGKIDEVAVWNSDQSANVASIYNSGVPTTITGSVAHWKMGEQATFSTNWTVPDAVGSSDGTSANMTIEDRVGDAPNSTSNALSYNMTESDRETDVPS